MPVRTFQLVLIGFAACGLGVTPGVGRPQLTNALAASAPAASTSYVFRGKISYYGDEVAGRKTSSGERFNPSALTMAHKTLPFGTKVRVTNLRNNKSVIVRVNDRGPGISDRVADLSEGAARELGMLGSGVVEARLEVVGHA